MVHDVSPLLILLALPRHRYHSQADHIEHLRFQSVTFKVKTPLLPAGELGFSKVILHLPELCHAHTKDRGSNSQMSSGLHYSQEGLCRLRHLHMLSSTLVRFQRILSQCQEPCSVQTLQGSFADLILPEVPQPVAVVEFQEISVVVHRKLLFSDLLLLYQFLSLDSGPFYEGHPPFSFLVSHPLSVLGFPSYQV